MSKTTSIDEVLAGKRTWAVACCDVLEGLRAMPNNSVQCCVTSPPYYNLRDYQIAGQIGLEPTLDEFLEKLVEVCEEVRRVLRDDGVFFCNMGDSYAGGAGGRGDIGNIIAGTQTRTKAVQAKRTPIPLGNAKPKDKLLVPWRLVLALQAAGWYVRDVIVWHKPAPMPESVTDRCTQSWEPIFLLTKSAKYFYDAEAVKEEAGKSGPYIGSKSQDGTLRKDIGNACATEWNGRNLRNVWTLAPEPFGGSHFATFPTELPRRCIKAGTSEHGCCPQCGAPWKRIVEREQIKRERPNEYVKRDGAEGTGNSCANTVAGVAVTTKGWEPTCKCNAGDAIPCVVMDIFNGSGTSGLVARRLGRRYVGFELNPDYAAMARERITSDAPLFNEAV